jgi:hypothetical protein
MTAVILSIALGLISYLAIAKYLSSEKRLVKKEARKAVTALRQNTKTSKRH